MISKNRKKKLRHGRKNFYLYGKNSCLERLRANPGSVNKIFLQDNFSSSEIEGLIQSNSISVQRLSEREMNKKKRVDRLQGIIAEVKRFEYTPIKEIIGLPDDKKPSLILLDNLNDPHNLGAIMRTAACFGDFAIVIPQHRSCEVNETVVHVASGGENYVPVAMSNNITQAALQAKEAGYWVMGTVIDEGQDITKTSIPFPVCLVLGSEGRGIGHSISKYLDLKVTLPMRGADLSFNVAMAASMFCYEITRQKGN